MPQIISPLMGLSFRPAEVKEIVLALEPGDELYLVRDEENEYDSNAIKVVNEDNIFLGFIAKEVAADLAPMMDEDEDLGIIVEVADTVNPRKPNLQITWPDE